MPTTAKDQTRRTLSSLGVTDTESLALLSFEQQERFRAELARSVENGSVEALWDEWIHSDDSVLNRIQKNWVEGSSPGLRQAAAIELQQLRWFVGLRLTASRPLEIPPGAVASQWISRAFDDFRRAFDIELDQCGDDKDLGVAKVSWLGRRSGLITLVTEAWLKRASADLKPIFGRELNALRAHIESQIESRRQAIESGADQSALAHERVDLSLPGVQRPVGSHHLIRQVFQEIEDIFFSIGFSVVEGPEIETPYYNFEALNIPEFHPVRDDMDTFYLDLPKGAPTPLLLRTHTSPMQIRTMEKQKPPVRVIVPGKVYRRDNPDATHSFIFHQVEGLAVDTDVTFCDFTGTIEYFVKQFFGPGVKTRFRPSYFPFTEPSVEFDVSCIFCGGSGTGAGGGTCSKCKGAGWIELFGAGMVDPAVYGFVGYDAKKVSGFAFGMGIDRLAMLKYGIDDIQVFFQNDVRFLRQFP
ncbi:MAG TPA: phenylalanine--tRNA ligase subunit alpha [Candidatus Solibacter sp.]|nr:phenylalanine--tRNA ligase subunit alpha [Candidatus Solibacter sp.]